MSEFPRLKTGAIAQYPTAKRIEYATKVLEFLDGNEQRYRHQRVPIRRWTVHLDLLSDEELNQIREFFEACQGGFGTFRFKDPWTGIVHENCRFEQDELVLELTDESRSRVVLVIVGEN